MLEVNPGLKRIPRIATAVGLLIPVLNLLAWWENGPVLALLADRLITMNPLTAVVFLLCGISLWFGHSEDRATDRRWIGNVAWGLGSALVVAKILGYFGWVVQVDRYLFRDRLIIGGHTANVMAPNTVVCFVLFLASLRMADARGKRGIFIFQGLAILTGFLALIVLIGYAYESKQFIQITHYLPMAVGTALTFVCYAVALLLRRPHAGLLQGLFTAGPGGTVARRLLPAVIAAPIVLGWIRVWGESRGYFDLEFGTAITISVIVLIFVLLIGWTANSLSSADRRLQAALADVTELNRILKDRNDKLRQTNEELDAFSSAASHDLQAPLRAISGLGEILLRKPELKMDAEATGLLERVTRSARTMATLVDSLLRLSRVGKQALVPSEVDLTALGKKIGSEFARASGTRTVRFSVKDDLRAVGDPALLEIALTNLLGNAWKYTGRTPGACVEFGSREEKGERVFYITDNGAGFDMAYADRLFGAFQRLHSTSDFEGTGIGLTTVQRIVERHGGRIWAEAALGKGATFYFVIKRPEKSASFISV